MDASPLVFHDKFNFHDGNILMSASGSRDGLPSSPVETVHFRLHKSVLAIYSTTFADMLSMPQGDTPVENVVVHLQDPLDHVIKLLTAIYYGGSVPQEPLSRATWNFLVPVLMLTDKYDMGTLAANLLPKLLEDWPTTLAEWDEVDSRASSISRDALQRRGKNPSLPIPNDLLPEPAIAIKFGQIHPAARNILPAAFYHLSRLSHSSSAEYGVYLYNPDVLRSADYGLLTSDDWLRAVRGQANIRDWLNGVADEDPGFNGCPRRKYRKTEDMDDDDDDGKLTPNPCRRWLWWNSNVKTSILRIGTEREVNVLARLKAIRDGIEHLDRTLTSEDQICNECHHTVVRSLITLRKEFWTRLPSFFRLEGYPNWGKS